MKGGCRWKGEREGPPGVSEWRVRQRWTGGCEGQGEARHGKQMLSVTGGARHVSACVCCQFFNQRMMEL